jgi:hypothetical protein
MSEFNVKNQKEILTKLAEEVNKIKADPSFVPGSFIQIPIETIKSLAKELNVGESDVLITLGQYLSGK